MQQFNSSDDDSTLGLCLPALCEHAAETYSARDAVVCGETRISFADLNHLANTIARRLFQHGVERGHYVGVMLERSIDLVAVLLAILKTGGAYVPIDPAFPAARISDTLEDVMPTLVVVQDSTRDKLSACGDGPFIALDELQDQTTSPCGDESNLDMDIRSDDIAYAIYTSGSTGKPKGVEVSHGAMCNLLRSVEKEPGFGDADRLLATTTISFDVSIPELFLPLISGGLLVMAVSHELKDPTALLRLVEQHSITTMVGTPTMFQMLWDAGWRGTPHLGKLLVGGEAFPRRLAERLEPCADDVWNMYGPTEAAIYAGIWRVTRDHDVILSKPTTNCRLYVLAEDLSPVSPGLDGELYIGGAGLARGYRNNEDLTKSAFIDNPFHGGRMYRTGDLARLNSPESLTVLGRADGQVKIRGHRVELGDVEASIMSHADVSGVAVVCRDGRLVAYCVLRAGGTLDESKALDGALRSWLADQLPSYMVPSFFVRLTEFPTTISGKIDRKGLPDPTETMQAITAAPKSGLGRSIRSIWSKVLGHDHIGAHDNFFEIGGDSARVVIVHKELEKLVGRSFSSARLFEFYTIDGLATYLANQDVRQKAPNQNPPPRHTSNEAIAVVSMACRLPGGVRTPEDYWELLRAGRDVTSDVPKDRWDSGAIHSTNPDAPGKSCSKRGGFLDSVDEFDASLFGISPREARQMDPAQRITLETCWEGFERAGYDAQQLRGSNTGIYVGVCSIPAHYPAPEITELDGYAVTGSGLGNISGRVSYALGCEGPSMTVDAMCASSLVTTHLACNALRQGECDMAISSGVSILLTPGMHIEFSRLRGMATDGRCRAFGAEAQGMGWAEGCTAVVLKRLSDAERDGDMIHAVLKGSAVNHGGCTAPRYTAPSGTAQQRLIKTALAVSGLAPDDIDYIEAHGTGTKLGDPIEGEAFASVFGGRMVDAEPLYVGSVKSNLGHTQAAGGLAGMLKIMLAMKNGTLPKTLYTDNPTPAIDWKDANMAPVQEARPWPKTVGRLRRAGVSAVGICGTNAHVIIEEAPECMAASHPPSADNQPPKELPFLLSGWDGTALYRQAKKLKEFLSGVDGNACSLGQVAYSLATTRTHMQCRLVLTATDKETLLSKLAASSCEDLLEAGDQKEEPRLAMLFTGQGSQVAEMGLELYETYPVYRRALDEITAEFVELPTSLLQVMHASAGSEMAKLLLRTEYAQPAIFAMEAALCRLWGSWGVQPDLVLGHSVGELAASHVAGVMGLSDACRLVAARGRLMQAVPNHGAMVSLEANAQEVESGIEACGLGKRVEIAGYNTPEQTVASGDADAVETLATHFGGVGRKAKQLEVSHAFHSHHMNSMLEAFREVCETVEFHAPVVEVVCSVSGKLADVGKGELSSAAYWVEQARRAVQFAGGMQTLHDQGTEVFLEVGARPVLCGLGAACLAEQTTRASWLPSLTKGKAGPAVMQRSLAELHVRRRTVNWAGFFQGLGLGVDDRIKLPTYAFARTAMPRMRKPGLLSSVDVAAKATDDTCTASDISSIATATATTTTTTTTTTWENHFEVRWGAAPAASTSSVPLLFGGLWGVLQPSGDTRWMRLAVKSLEKSGLLLVRVASLDDATQLNGVFCLWDGDGNTRTHASIGDEATVPARALGLAAAGLKQLQSAALASFTTPIVWVTRRAVGAGEGDRAIASVAAAPLWGMARTARSEHPELVLHLIDVDVDMSTDTDPRTDHIESAAPGLGFALAVVLSGEPECAVRRGRVLVPRLERAVPNAHLHLQHLQPWRRAAEGAVLITGGLGGLGRHIACFLARQHGVRDVVLVSRKGIAASGASELVRELAGLGAAATVVAADVADFDSIAALFAAQFGPTRPLRGVVHAAGVYEGGVLSTLTPERFATTFAPKVDGAWHLHRLTRSVDLDFFVLLSSVSGVTGMLGLANYAAANTFLDALAYLRRAQGLPGTSIAYGMWAGDGMAARIADNTRIHLEQHGLALLAPDDGLALLDKAVRSGRALSVAAAFDVLRLQQYHDDEGSHPPLYHSLLSVRRHRLPAPGAQTQPRDLPSILQNSPPSQRASVLLARVRETVAKAFGFARGDDVDVHRPLRDLGIDSLTAVLLRNKLASLTGLSLSARIAFQYPDLQAISDFLLGEFKFELEQSSPASGVSTAPTSEDSNEPEIPFVDLAAIRRGVLDSGFEFSTSCASPKPPTSVLVSGATGFVGAFLVHELLKRGITVHCVVRAQSDAHALQRILSTLTEYGIWSPECATLLHAFAGDVSKPLLGLSRAAFDDLADIVDAVCHSAALVDWMRPLDVYLGPNVVSTHEILRLASQGRIKTVHFISSISALPSHLGYEVNENDGEAGYGLSKFLSERLLSAARWRGLKASSYRLPLVAASAASGHFRQDRGDFLHNLISGSLEMGAFPSLHADLASVIPVDHLCKCVIAIMTQDMHRIGQDFDFINGEPQTFDEYFGKISALSGGLEILPFETWQSKALTYASTHPNSPIARIIALVDGYDNKSFSATLTGMTRGENVFGVDDRPVFSMDREYVRRYLNRMITFAQ